MFNVGDDVEYSYGFNYDGISNGMTGKVVHLYGDSWIGVSWDGFNKGHNCEGHTKDCSGYYVPAERLQLSIISLENE